MPVQRPSGNFFWDEKIITEGRRVVGGHIRNLKKQYMPVQRPSGNFFGDEKIITEGRRVVGGHIRYLK